VSIGAATSPTERAAIWGGDNDNEATSQKADSSLQQDRILEHNEPGGTPAVNAEADFVSFDADGWTLNWITADATARQILALAIGDADDPLERRLVFQKPEPVALVSKPRLQEVLVR
jgi:hypothetical protein